ncbi:MAG: MarR family transcriptional regulator [Chitinophagales bacterium]|nr:MarR family transcriptional regulator [Chitinophagales bacterium]
MPNIEEHIITKPIKDPHLRAVLNTMFTGVWLQQKMGQTLKPFGITEPQYNVLRILRGQKGASMNLYAIQERMIQKMSNVSRLIDKLLAKKLVTRKESKENRRRVDIAITAKGLELLEEVEPVITQNVFKQITNNISKEEAKMIGELLDVMRNE